MKEYLKIFYRHYFIGVLKRLDQHHAFLMAGALTFYIFVCFIPLTLIIFWILGNILSSSTVTMQVNNFIDTLIPYKNYAEFAKFVLSKRIVELVEYKNIAGIVGFGGLLFAASGLFSSLRLVLNNIFGPAKNIGAFVGLLIDMGLVLVLISLLLLTILLVPILDFLRAISANIPYFDFLNRGIFGGIISTVITFVVITLVYGVFYKIVPTRKIKNRSMLIGASFAAALWIIVKEIFGFYLYNYAQFGQIYGTYSLAIVISFWVFTSSILFIAGAEICAIANERIFEKEALPKQKKKK